MKSILIQLDTDPLASSFDRVVAVDAGADEIFSYGGVTDENVEALVHGAMFTRGPADLRHTAIFVGGSDVAGGEKVLRRVLKTFFGPLRVSVMMDSNGSNTTAAAAVLAARKHLSLKGAPALVLGGTGPVGQRVGQLLAREGARVRIGSRSSGKAAAVCETIRSSVDGADVSPYATESAANLQKACAGVAVIIAAGAAGVQLLSKEQTQSLGALEVAIDLNAVPPPGIEGIEPTAKAADPGGVVCYGAIGVGGTKMKIHKAAIQSLFTANDRVLDTEAIYAIGESAAG